ncbi:expressed unknown protein [Seminavis robusta]|uniref:Uncharacterized protein n=1 Tax=Seminavis robusta TaxID=568900 RepID=A0A9N8E1N2_9STRA|nr:expressed unknown protein [Seminavis robusta]|eukprot:Sro561_g166881.1  (159) ;mRNA; f:54556-55032
MLMFQWTLMRCNAKMPLPAINSTLPPVCAVTYPDGSTAIGAAIDGLEASTRTLTCSEQQTFCLVVRASVQRTTGTPEPTPTTGTTGPTPTSSYARVSNCEAVLCENKADLQEVGGVICEGAQGCDVTILPSLCTVVPRLDFCWFWNCCRYRRLIRILC